MIVSIIIIINIITIIIIVIIIEWRPTCHYEMNDYLKNRRK